MKAILDAINAEIIVLCLDTDYSTKEYRKAKLEQLRKIRLEIEDVYIQGQL